MRLAVPLLLLFTLAACDTGPVEPALRRSAAGQVVSLSTGEPLAGLSVVLREPGAVPRIYQRGVTDADGRFRLPPAQTDDRVDLAVNEGPYNPAVYSWNAFGEGVPLGPDMRIGLWEIAELVVYAETDTPLGEGDRFFLNTPCVGADSSPVEAGCARGNTENEITLTVTRGGQRTTEVRQVVAPLGERTEVRFRY